MKIALALYWFEYQDLVIYKCVLYQNSVAITYNKYLLLVVGLKYCKPTFISGRSVELCCGKYYLPALYCLTCLDFTSKALSQSM